MKKRILAFVLVLALMIGVVPANAANAQTFTDVPPNHWAYSYIREAAADGAVNGVGNNRFDPDGVLTIAEWSCILARAFYGAEVEAKTRTNWFNRETEVLAEHRIYANVGTLNSIQYSSPASRTVMAETVANLLTDKGITADASKVAAAKAEITDLDSIYPMHHEAVGICWALGIINGVGGGRFDGNGSMERAAAAAVYSRVKKVLADASSTPDVPSEPPTTPTTPTTGSVVGTMSSVPLNLGKNDIASHAPITDFWAQQSMEIRNISDRNSFNAACQTIKDSNMILTQGEFVRTRNVYYHYAMAAKVGNAAQNNVGDAMGALNGWGGGYGNYGDSSFVYYILVPDTAATTSAPRFASTISQINANPSMTDRQKAELCVKAVCDQIDYQVDGGASWGNGKETGDCTAYARMLNQILSAAGLPNLNVAGRTKEGNHAWVQVKLDGQWYVMDGTMAETGFDNGGIMSFDEHKNLWEYPTEDVNNRDAYKVARALIDAAYPG